MVYGESRVSRKQFINSIGGVQSDLMSDCALQYLSSFNSVVEPSSIEKQRSRLEIECNVFNHKNAFAIDGWCL